MHALLWMELTNDLYTYIYEHKSYDIITVSIIIK